MKKELGERRMLGHDDRRIMRLIDQYEKDRKTTPGLTVESFIVQTNPPARLRGRLKTQLQTSNLLTTTGTALRKRATQL